MMIGIGNHTAPRRAEDRVIEDTFSGGDDDERKDPKRRMNRSSAHCGKDTRLFPGCDLDDSILAFQEGQILSLERDLIPESVPNESMFQQCEMEWFDFDLHDECFCYASNNMSVVNPFSRISKRSVDQKCSLHRMHVGNLQFAYSSFSVFARTKFHLFPILVLATSCFLYVRWRKRLLTAVCRLVGANGTSRVISTLQKRTKTKDSTRSLPNASSKSCPRTPARPIPPIGHPDDYADEKREIVIALDNGDDKTADETEHSGISSTCADETSQNSSVSWWGTTVQAMGSTFGGIANLLKPNKTLCQIGDKKIIPLQDILQLTHHGWTGDGILASSNDLDVSINEFAAGCGLLQAAARGDIAAMERLIQQYPLHVNFRDYDRRTALHVAASEGRLLVCTLLVDKYKARINRSDRWGGSPLDDAYRHKHVSVIYYLQEKGATTGSRNRSTNLLQAAADGDVDEIKLLLRSQTCCEKRNSRLRTKQQQTLDLDKRNHDK